MKRNYGGGAKIFVSLLVYYDMS